MKWWMWYVQEELSRIPEISPTDGVIDDHGRPSKYLNLAGRCLVLTGLQRAKGRKVNEITSGEWEVSVELWDKVEEITGGSFWNSWNGE